jgi:hypothetical protein
VGYVCTDEGAKSRTLLKSTYIIVSLYWIRGSHFGHWTVQYSMGLHGVTTQNIIQPVQKWEDVFSFDYFRQHIKRSVFSSRMYIVWIYKMLTSQFICWWALILNHWAMLGRRKSCWRFVSSLSIPYSTIYKHFHHFKMPNVSFFFHKSVSWSPSLSSYILLFLWL